MIIHSVLSEDDLIYLLSVKRKELRMFCNRLVEDRLLSTHLQKEENVQLRLITRTYYYIHITEAIDAIKWKVHSVVNKLKQEMSQYGNPHGFLCKRCGKKFSQLDAMSLLSPDRSQFVCDNCGFTLIEDDSNEQASIKQESLEKLMIQLDPIIAFLKKIDDSVIEDNNFESALIKSIPAQSSGSAIFSLSNKYTKSKLSSPSASSLKSQATLHVSITATDENEDKERQMREERRQKLQQNALPSWHSTSTVGQEIPSNANTPEPETFVKPEPVVKPDPESEIKSESPELSQEPAAVASSSELKDREAQDALAAYYAELAEREADDDDEDEDDEDDFDDFEDI